MEQRLQAVEADGFGELSKEGSIVTPQSCVEWSRLHGEGYTPTTTLEEQPDGAARIRCGTLALLRRVAPAQQSFLRNLTFDDTVLSALPAAVATGFSSERERQVSAASQAGKSLRAFNPRARAARNQETQLFEIKEEPGEASTILVAPEAWGDFTGDGIDDLVVSVVNLSGGSANQYRLLVLTRSSERAVLRVVSTT